jgi:uridylate kinase
VPQKSDKPAYKRILLKLSGEALMGRLEFGISPEVMDFIAGEIKALVEARVQVALVVGGGNIFRGEGLAKAGMDRVTGDQMGIQDTLERHGVPVRVQSAVRINEVCEDFIRRKAVRHLEKGRVVVFAAGTGNPFFTTDSAAALRAVEINADLLLKATKVDGIYNADPKKDRKATRFDQITYDEALSRKLGVMDQTAMVLCRDHGVKLRVYDMQRPGALRKIVMGDDSIGTRVIS